VFNLKERQEDQRGDNGHRDDSDGRGKLVSRAGGGVTVADRVHSFGLRVTAAATESGRVIDDGAKVVEHIGFRFLKTVARRETFDARGDVAQAVDQSEVALARVAIAGLSDAAVVGSAAVVAHITTWWFLSSAAVPSSAVQSVSRVLNDVEEADVSGVTLAFV